jgi:hypothetical protein
MPVETGQDGPGDLVCPFLHIVSHEPSFPSHGGQGRSHGIQDGSSMGDLGGDAQRQWRLVLSRLISEKFWLFFCVTDFSEPHH